EMMLFKFICHALYTCDAVGLDLITRQQLQQEEPMVDGLMIRRLVNDLIINEEYSIAGLAHYTGFPEDVIYDLASGINNDPTISLAYKIIELHAQARQELYLSLLHGFVQSA